MDIQPVVQVLEKEESPLLRLGVSAKKIPGILETYPYPALANFSLEKLEIILGKVPARRFVAARELLKTNNEAKLSISSPADASEIFKKHFIENHYDPDREHLMVACLNRRNIVIGIFKVYSGSVSSSNVRIGEIYEKAVLLSASAIVVCHNHPGGDAKPSSDDEVVTRAINQAGRLLDIELLDHIVICPFKEMGSYVSLKERGLFT